MASILLIEDDLTFSRILEGFLTKKGYQVTTSHKGKDGLKSGYRKVDPELRALEEENARLKKIIANQALELKF